MRAPFVPSAARGRTSGELVQLFDIVATTLELADIELKHVHFSRSLAPYLRAGALPTDFTPRRYVFTEGGYATNEPRDHEGWDGLPEKSSDYYYKEALEMAVPLSVCRAVSVRAPGRHTPSYGPPPNHHPVPRSHPHPEPAAAPAPTQEFLTRTLCQSNAHHPAPQVRNLTHKLVYRSDPTDADHSSELYDLVADPYELRNLYAEPSAALLRAELKEQILQWLVQTSDITPWSVCDRVSGKCSATPFRRR